MKLILFIFFIHLAYANIELSLENAVKYTLKHDFNLKLAKLDRQISKTSIKKEDALFEPRISASAFKSSDKSSPARERKSTNYSTSLTNRFSTGTTATLSYNHDENIYDTSGNSFNSYATLSLEQELLKGFGNSYNLTNFNVAKKRYELSLQNELQQQIQTVYAVELAYWTYLKAYEDLRIRKQSQKLSIQLLEQKKKEVAFGAYAKINLLEIEADVLSKKRQISSTLQTFIKTKIELLRTMNAPMNWYKEKIIPTQKPNLNSPTLSENDLMQIALKNRQDFIKSKLNIDINDLLKKYNKERLKPNLSLKSSATNNAPSKIRNGYDAFDTFSKQGWLIALNFSYELFNNSAKADAQKASLNLQRSKTILAKLTNDIYTQVLDAKNALNYSKKIAELTIKEYKQQEKVLEAEKLKLKSGMSNIRDYLFNQNALILSELNLIENKVSFMKSLALLYKTVGIVSPKFVDITGANNAK